MKKLFIIAAAACVTLASCVKNEPMPNQGGAGDLITFAAPIMAPNVKSVAGYDSGNLPNFNVWGYISASSTGGVFNVDNPYIPGDEVSCSETESVWSTSTAYYWPQVGTISFVALAPAGAATAEVTAEGIQIGEYTADGSQDLLISDVAYDQTKQTAADGVDIVFHHALSAIKFNVKTDVEGNTLVVKSITLNGVKKTGAFAQGLDGSADAQMGVAEDNVCWTPAGENGSYSVTVGDEGIQLSGTSAPVGTDAIDLIVLPQEITRYVELSVVYSFKNVTMNEAIEQTVTTPLALQNVPSQWYRGYCYTYNLNVHLDKITFDPSVEEWLVDQEDSTDKVYDVDAKPSWPIN